MNAVSWLETSAATDPRGNVISAIYDARGRINRLTQPLGAITEWDRNTDNLVTEIRSATGNGGDPWARTKFTYYPDARVKTSEDADGFITETRHDDANRALVSLDAEGRKMRTVYDDAGRPITTIKAWSGLMDGPGATFDENGALYWYLLVNCHKRDLNSFGNAHDAPHPLSRRRKNRHRQ